MTDVLRQRLDALFEKKLFTNTVVENFKKGIRIKKTAKTIKKSKVVQKATKKTKAIGKKVKKKAKVVGKKGKAGKKKGKKKLKIKTPEEGQPFLQKEFGFRYVTWKSLGTGKGWRNVFNILFFIIPALILLLADTIVNIKILKTKFDPKYPLKYQKYKANDKLWIYHSGIEFLQIFIAAYIASAFYHLIFIERHRDMEMYFRSEVNPSFGFDFSVLFFGLVFLPRFFYFIIYKTVFRPHNSNNDSGNGELYQTDQRNIPEDDKPIEVNVSEPEKIIETLRDVIHNNGRTSNNNNEQTGSGSSNALSPEEIVKKPSDLEGLKLFLPFKDSRTIVYLFFYCVAFFICSFLLSKIATLFLDVFIFKANPIMYIFILLGFLQWSLDVIMKMHINIKIDPSGKETIKVPNPKYYHLLSWVYWVYLFFHFLFAMGCAPVAQAIFTLYLLSFMINVYKIIDWPGNLWTLFWTNISNSRVKADLSEYNASKPSSTNDFFHRYIFQNNNLMFSFVFTLFFFWKCLTSIIPGVGLKIHGLYWSLLIINFLLAALCGKIYHHFYSELYPATTPLSSTP